MIGKTLAHYRIIEKIGAGGMGEVYRARDTKLSRDVAIKVLPVEMTRDPDRLARFQLEAKSLAAVNHPGIVTIYSIERSDDCTFLTMELVRGQSLAARIAHGPLPLDEFLDLATSLTAALAAAHGSGVVHRDLKPSNVMIDEDRNPRILDFGLAKLLEPSTYSDVTLRATGFLTRTGAILGTPAYMAPEQIEGREIDHRIDLFALGLVLFEAATGRHAFTGESTPAIISSILRDRVASVSDLRPEWPRDVSRIIGRCLEKDPRRRFQTARDVHNELRDVRDEIARQPEPPSTRVSPASTLPTRAGDRRIRLAGPTVLTTAVLITLAAVFWIQLQRGREREPTPARDSDPIMIAVLPFENLGSADDAYFAAGITEEITSRLAGVERLGVISRTSTVQYQGTTKSLREIGEELGVDYVLEGTVRWASGPEGHERVRITPQLIRVADDTHLWTDRYDNVLEDVFGVQSEIARSVVRQLGVTLLRPARETLERKPTSDLAAYEAYLRALDADSKREAIPLLERAVELDPSFAEAWALLADQHAYLYRFGWDQTPTRLAAAESSLARASALAPENHEVLRAAAYVQYYAHSDYVGALETFEKLLECNPSSAGAYEGKGYIRRRQGRLEEAVSFLERAHRLDPRDANIVQNLARTWEARRAFDVADSLYRKAIALNPEDCFCYERWALLALEQGGDLKESVRRISGCPADGIVGPGLEVLYMADDHDGVLEGTERALSRELPPAGRGVYHTIRAWSLRALGRTSLSEAEALIGRDLLRTAAAEGPDNAAALSFLALNLATFGESEEAIPIAEEAARFSTIDRFGGPRLEVYLAGVYFYAGRTEEAIQLLDRLLIAQYDRPITPALLRIHWLFEPFRLESAFQELVEHHANLRQAQKS